MVDHGDLVGDLHRLVLVVGDEDRGHVDDVVQLAQPLAQLRANPSVEGAERLVEQEHLRLGREGTGEAHALPLAARQLSWITVAEALQLDEVQELVDAVGDLGLRPLAHFQAEGDVLADGHVLERGVVLEHEADVSLLGCERGCVLAAEEDLAGVCRLEPGDDSEQGRLSGAARAEESGERTRLHVERDILEGDEVAEPLRDVADEDRHQAVSSLPGAQDRDPLADPGRAKIPEGVRDAAAVLVTHVSSFGRMTVMATRTRIAMSASTIEMAYAPARSNAS